MSRISARLNWIASVTLMLALAGTVGCSRPEPEAAFEPNLVHAMKYQVSEDIPMQQATDDALWVVTQMFGTPDAPKIPDVVSEDEELASIVSLERLTRASGPAGAEGRGLYQQHCMTCHGLAGDGRGPTAAAQTPTYPRDYRLGIFKFKSTPRGVKPTRDDLTRTIAHGINGTMMKKIPELSEEDVQALVDYVIYLSWRGQLERTLIDDAILELDLEAGDRITNGTFGERFWANEKWAETLAEVNDDTDGDELVEYEQYLAFAKRMKDDPKLEDRLKAAADSDEKVEKDDEAAAQLAADLEAYDVYLGVAEDLQDDKETETRLAEALKKVTGEDLLQFELFTEAWEIDEDYAVEIAESWLEAGDEVLEVPDPPADLPLPETYEEFQALSQGDQATALAASVQRGQELFVGKIANCSKCHGEKGLGNGQTTDYDDWVKDWTLRVNLKPDDRESLIPMLARGALPPVNAIPRNFEAGIFRGGASSRDLYRRITQGIDGTPMPAATFVEGKFEEQDVWHLINFIRSLQTAPLIPDTPAEPVSADETPAT